MCRSLPHYSLTNMFMVCKQFYCLSWFINPHENTREVGWWRQRRRIWDMRQVNISTKATKTSTAIQSRSRLFSHVVSGKQHVVNKTQSFQLETPTWCTLQPMMRVKNQYSHEWSCEWSRRSSTHSNRVIAASLLDSQHKCKSLTRWRFCVAIIDTFHCSPHSHSTMFVFIVRCRRCQMFWKISMNFYDFQRLYGVFCGDGS